jgi:glycosyltransferase involved in cell wall biosynthesis
MAFETFGISIIEAQAAGLPVVGVDAGAMPDRVSPDLGILGPVDDADAMAENIANLWLSGQASKMGYLARAHVERHFSWRRTFTHLFGEIYPPTRTWLA